MRPSAALPRPSLFPAGGPRAALDSPAPRSGARSLEPWRLAFWTALLVGSLASGAAAPAVAATFVMVPDSGLVDRAEVIATVRVAGRAAAPGFAGGSFGSAWTDYLVEIDDLIKGRTAGSTLTVRVPGGEGPDGMMAVVHGAPRFEIGERALLFLDPVADGSWRVRHLMLGAFHLVRVEDRTLAVRDLTGASPVPPVAGHTRDPVVWRGPRSLPAFVRWMIDRLHGVPREPDYFVPASELDSGNGLRTRLEAFTLLQRGGREIRWFEFDRGESVFWRARRAQPGLSPAQRRHAIERGMELWNAVGGTNIRLAFAGEGSSDVGFAAPDGINTILFDDPSQTFGADGFDCDPASGGGALAAARSWLGPGTRSVRGRPHGMIVEADVVFNRNLGCYFDRIPNPGGTADAIVGHELGHTLGIGHSSQRDPEPKALLRDALMYFRARASLGRDARLNLDDRRAARALYGTGPPRAPSSLVAEAVSDTEALLTWVDNADDESSFRVEQAVEDGRFVQIIGFLPRDSRSVMVGNLTPDTRYRFRVRSHNKLGFSDFSNEAELIAGRLVAPEELRVVNLTEREVDLSWSHPRLEEVGFRIEIRSPAGPLASRDVPAGLGRFVVDALDPDTPYTFRIRALRKGRQSRPGPELSVTTRGGPAGPCVAGDRSLCLLGDRFRVRVSWRDPRSGDRGSGRVIPVPGSDVSGLVWFFDASNIELVVKMLDGVEVNGSYWTFYGGLSDLELWVHVLDTETGQDVTYHSPPGEICGLADVESFPRRDPPGPLPATSLARSVRRYSVTVPPELGTATAAQVSGTCTPGPETLCLLDGRFRVTVEWENPRSEEDRGVGTVAPVESVAGDRTGFFWFFSPENLELLVKMLDGRGINGRFWVFYGALTDVGYRLTVTDTVESVTRTYEKAPLDLCGGSDVRAF